MTFHGSRLPDDLLLPFWDQIHLAEDTRAIVFISLALLLENSAAILQQNLVELPEFISRLGMTSKEHILRLVKKVWMCDKLRIYFVKVEKLGVIYFQKIIFVH